MEHLSIVELGSNMWDNKFEADRYDYDLPELDGDYEYDCD